MTIWHVAPLRVAPAFRELGVCEHFWPFSLRNISATLLSPKWAEIFVAQMAGDKTSLPRSFAREAIVKRRQLLSYSCDSKCNDKRWRLNRNLEWRNQSSE